MIELPQLEGLAAHARYWTHDTVRLGMRLFPAQVRHKVKKQDSSGMSGAVQKSKATLDPFPDQRRPISKIMGLALRRPAGDYAVEPFCLTVPSG